MAMACHQRKWMFFNLQALGASSIDRPFSTRELRQCDQWQDLHDVLESHLLDFFTSTSDATPRGGGGEGGCLEIV